MDEIRLDSYSTALAEEFMGDEDTLAVLRKLGRTKREEWEPKIPELANLIEMVQRTAKQRVWDEQRPAKEEERRLAEEAMCAKIVAENEAAFLERKQREAGEPVRATPRYPTTNEPTRDYLNPERQKEAARRAQERRAM